MVPGGSDFVFEFRDDQISWARQYVTRVMMDHWPQAIVVAGDEVMSHLHEVPFGQINEFFIYQNGEWLKYIEEHGVDEKAQGRMVHVLSYGSQITMVCEEGPPMTSVVTRIKSYIEHRIT